MNKSSLYISLLALAVSAAAFTVTVKRSSMGVSSVTAEEVASILNENPKIIIDAANRYAEIERENQIKEAAKAFQDNIEDLNNNPTTPFVGNADSDIVLVEFFDFSCGYCKRLAPTVEALIKENPDVKFVFKPVTFVSQISMYAAQAAMAAHKQGKFMAMYDGMLKAPNRLTEGGINDLAKANGLDMEQFNADVNSDEVKKAIAEVAALSGKVNVRGVPMLILNGVPLQTNDQNAIQAEINKLK